MDDLTQEVKALSEEKVSLEATIDAANEEMADMTLKYEIASEELADLKAEFDEVVTSVEGEAGRVSR